MFSGTFLDAASLIAGFQLPVLRNNFMQPAAAHIHDATRPELSDKKRADKMVSADDVPAGVAEDCSADLVCRAPVNCEVEQR